MFAPSPGRESRFLSKFLGSLGCKFGKSRMNRKFIPLGFLTMTLSIRISKLAAFTLRLLLVLASFAQIPSASASVATANLEWDRNPETNIAGYLVHYGTTSGDYSKSREVSTLPTATLTDLEVETTYYCVVQAFTTSGLRGLYSSEISFTVPKSNPPDFSVAHAWGSDRYDLTAASQAIDFGDVDLATPGLTNTFILKNPGTAPLTGLAVTGNDQNFSVTRLGTTTLAPGEITVFNVTFRPSATGSYATVLHVVSGETGESALDISLTGTGVEEPEIAVEQPIIAELTASTSAIHFEDTPLGTTSATQVVTLSNTGSDALTGLQITPDGPDAASFVLELPPVTSLAPGASTDFRVSFTPSGAGFRGASLRFSSDSTAQAFVKIGGNGIAVPEISVHLSNGKDLIDEAASINFSSVKLGKMSDAQVFTIHNSGSAFLENLAISKNGSHTSDFTVNGLRTTSLAPGASTEFNINFRPSGTGVREATIQITSNDGDETNFDIIVTGNGIKPLPAVMLGLQPLSAPIQFSSNCGVLKAPVRGIEVIGGRKYLTLTLAKTPGKTVIPRSVEVSSNLVVWSSGKTHTTVLIDNATTLKVRDNTPLTRNAKRYIRLKPRAR